MSSLLTFRCECGNQIAALMQDASDFDLFFGNSIEEYMRVRQDRTEPGHKFISRTAHQRMSHEPLSGMTDVSKQSIGNVDRSDSGEVGQISNRSFRARGAQTTRLGPAMLVTRLPDHVFDIEFTS